MTGRNQNRVVRRLTYGDLSDFQKNSFTLFFNFNMSGENPTNKEWSRCQFVEDQDGRVLLLLDHEPISAGDLIDASKIRASHSVVKGEDS